MDGSMNNKAPAHKGVVVPCRNIPFSLGPQLNIPFIDEKKHWIQEQQMRSLQDVVSPLFRFQ
jgi:hypothetical protein